MMDKDTLEFMRAAGHAQSTPMMKKDKYSYERKHDSAEKAMSDLGELIKKKNRKLPNVSGKIFGRGVGM